MAQSGGPSRGGRSTQSRSRARLTSVPKFQIGQLVSFAGLESVVCEVGERAKHRGYLIENGANRLPMWVPEEVLEAHQQPGLAGPVFRQEGPDLVVVDDFFHDPDQVRSIALAQEYSGDLRYYKGVRSNVRFLWPWLREEFGQLIGRPVATWLEFDANGVFQQTSHDDPLVWHHDNQQFAAAIYLTRDPPPGSGTSFWRDRSHGCRRRPTHPRESRRLKSDEAVASAAAVVYNPETITSPDNWELVEVVAGLYNRLVIWDASLFHSATSYEHFRVGTHSPTRLVQLFFFD